MSTSASARLTLVFSWWQFPMLPSRAVNKYYIIMNVSLIKCVRYVLYITFGFRTIQVKWMCLYFSAHTTPVRIYGEPYAHKFCAVDIFLEYQLLSSNITLAKSHHVLGRGFMIQRLILIFIKCLSASQNQLFYMKV